MSHDQLWKQTALPLVCFQGIQTGQTKLLQKDAEHHTAQVWTNNLMDVLSWWLGWTFICHLTWDSHDAPMFLNAYCAGIWGSPTPQEKLEEPWYIDLLIQLSQLFCAAIQCAHSTRSSFKAVRPCILIMSGPRSLFG